MPIFRPVSNPLPVDSLLLCKPVGVSLPARLCCVGVGSWPLQLLWAASEEGCDAGLGLRGPGLPLPLVPRPRPLPLVREKGCCVGLLVLVVKDLVSASLEKRGLRLLPRPNAPGFLDRDRPSVTRDRPEPNS